MSETKNDETYIIVRFDTGTVNPVLCKTTEAKNIIEMTQREFPKYKILETIPAANVPDLDMYLARKYNLQKARSGEGRKKNCSHRFCMNIEYGENISVHKVLKPFRRDDGVLCIKATADFKHKGKFATKITFHRGDRFISQTASTHCSEPTCKCTYGIYIFPISDFDA